MPPRAFIRSTDSLNSAAAAALPKKARSCARGTPKRKGPDEKSTPKGFAARLKTSASSGTADTASTACASAAVRAKMDTVSTDRQAGTTPVAESRPRLGLRPIRLLKLAGTRPEPAVSVPNEKLTQPLATLTAEPELEPPDTKSGLKALRHAP